MGPYEEILRSLADARIEFIVGGGVACVFHGVERVTMDVDVAVQMQPEIEATFAQTPGGVAMTHALFGAVKTSLSHGLEVVFFWSAVIMTAAVLVHLALRSEPLRTQMAEPDVPMH